MKNGLPGPGQDKDTTTALHRVCDLNLSEITALVKGV